MRNSRDRRPDERKAKVAQWLGQRASRNTGLFDKACRWMLHRIMTLPPDEDFMRDEWVDNDTGYDAEELERYQRGLGSGRRHIDDRNS